MKSGASPGHLPKGAQATGSSVLSVSPLHLLSPTCHPSGAWADPCHHNSTTGPSEESIPAPSQARLGKGI